MDCLTARHGSIRLLVMLAATLAVFAGVADRAWAQSPRITATPGLFPAFNTSVSDYVTRCQPADSVSISVSAPAGTYVSVDGGPQQTGSFTQTVSLSAGQEFDITTIASSQSTTYFVRCLPSDFPAFTATRSGPTQAAYYVVAPSMFSAPAGISRRYVAIFNTNGVPLWWMPSSGTTDPVDATLLPDGDIAWLHLWPAPRGMEEHGLDGSLVRTLNTVGSGADDHDFQLLPNGNYLIGRPIDRYGVDMSSCGGPTKGRLVDFQLQELTPSGALVWSWLASTHIPFTALAPQWQTQCKYGGDIYHWNSVEPDGNSYILSFRHLDAVYGIDAKTGAINWKLGGSPTPQSLTVLNDVYSATSTFCGQHDARVLPDGTLTVFDNGTGCNRPPRDERFAIDPTARTATLVQTVSDPGVLYSYCCGSARDLPGGDWVTAWGATRRVTEQTATGAIVFQLAFGSSLFTYRADPVLPGVVSAAQLRAGMDAQYPR